MLTLATREVIQGLVANAGSLNRGALILYSPCFYPAETLL
jgi:hypothetical protein